jgi:hypothetical protein
LSFARFCLLIVLALAGVLTAAACSDEGSVVAPSPTASTGEGTPGLEPSPTSAVADSTALTGYCEPPTMDTTPYQLDVKAEWKGDDRIVIEGSVLLAEAASLQYVICQDGEVSLSLIPVYRPELKGGKITAESELLPSESGPAFDPDAKFEVVLYFLREDVQIPILIAKVPVEGRPD